MAKERTRKASRRNFLKQSTLITVAAMTPPVAIKAAEKQWDERLASAIENITHVPVHADVPDTEVFFAGKPDYIVDPIGTKGIGEIAIIGGAPTITNAICNATGKRIRELPVTPDKLI